MSVSRIIRRAGIGIAGFLFHLRKKRSVVFLGGAPLIDGIAPNLYALGTVSVGRRCVFRSFRLRASLGALKGGVLTLGDHVFINDGVNICAADRIEIGSFTRIGDMVTIYDSSFHAVSPGEDATTRPVSIGRNVWIGANATILPGSIIGDHSVIGAGSLVTGAIPSRCVAVGNPARAVKTFEAPDDWIRL